MQNLKRARKPRKNLYPLTVEKQFQTKILELVRTQKKDVNELLTPLLTPLKDEANIKLDDYSDKITGIMGQLDILGNQQLGNMGFGGVKEYTGTVSNEVNKFNHKDFNKVVKSVIGVDIFKEEPWLKAELNNFSEEASSYITKMSKDNLTEIARITRKGVSTGLSSKVIKEQIQKQFNLTSNRAKLIARDQVATLNGRLTEKRQEAIGVKEYIWRTAQDERVRGNPGGLYPNARPSHWAREGKTFKWSAPGIKPGSEIQCRCYAEMVLPEDLLNEYGFTNKPAPKTPKRRVTRIPVTKPITKVVEKVIKKKPVPVVKKPAIPKDILPDNATNKQVNEWAVRNGVADNVDFKGIDPQVSKLWVEHSKTQIDKFPELKMQFTGSCQNRNKLHKKSLDSAFDAFIAPYIDRYPKGSRYYKKLEKSFLNARVGRIQSGVVAQSTSREGFKGISVSKNTFKTFEEYSRMMNRNITTGWWAKGDALTQVIDHELGHELDRLLNIRKNPEIIKLWDSSDVRKELSNYGATSKGEMIAEGWAEYVGNPAPRPLAKQIGEIIENEYSKRNR